MSSKRNRSARRREAAASAHPDDPRTESHDGNDATAADDDAVPEAVESETILPPAIGPRAALLAPRNASQGQLERVGAPERLIGAVLRDAGEIDAAQIEHTLKRQREQGGRFGENAVALGYVTSETVLWALGQQQRVAYAGGVPSQHEVSDELAVLKQPKSRGAEVIRDIRSQLLAGVLDPKRTPRRALAVTSLDAGDGRSWFAANLAISLSQTGARTLLIDADLRTPRLAAMFGLEHPPAGLAGVLAGEERLAYSAPVPELRRLYLLPAGDPPWHPLELLQGEAFGMLLSEVVAKFDHVIVDTPAAARSADGRVIASRCGTALAIGRKRQSRLNALHAFLAQLRQADTVVAGLVVNEA